DVQKLSHRLHPARLRIVGLEIAAREMCRDVSERSGVEIEFRSEAAAGTLPEDLSVCLYRVLQEALQNAIKHSGSRRILVRLQFGTVAVTLTIQDSGAGFDLDAAARAGGLGLITMKERLKLVGGTLAIETTRDSGTTIQARVPLTT